MNPFTPGQELTPFRIIGYNYAADHDNKIHSDEVASQYGFRGGLVPGVGVYAYLTQPVVAALGRVWLQRGAVTAKFLKPIYHGEEVVAQATVINIQPLTCRLELCNAEGILCAVGEASLPQTTTEINPADYPARMLPAPRPAATIANLPVGTVLGTLEWTLDLPALATKFLSDMRASSPLYGGPEAVCHPAFYLAQANEILMLNAKLGPWIHTGSEVQQYRLPRNGERLSLRGTVVEALEKRGHEIVALELGLFAEGTQPIARIRHRAIIRLRQT